MTNPSLPPENDDQPESKSQRKRLMLALQKIGETLVELPEAQFKKIPLEDSLLEAVKLARTLKTHESKRRQLQYIGKIMRHIDPAPIEAALLKIQDKGQKSKAHFHQIERLRTLLIAKGDSALQTFLEQYPNADHQHIRQLVRKSQQDAINHKNSGSETELFRYIRTLLEK